MSINKYPSNAAVASVAISTGISGNGTNADQADTNATDATAFVISTNVNMPVGMYTVTGVNGNAKSKTAISQTASSLNNGIYVSTGTTQFYAYVPATWATRPFAFSTGTALQAVGYGNGKYVASIGGANYQRWSTNAITWTTTTTQFDGNRAIKYLNNLWFALGTANNRNLWTSTDGLTWTSRTIPMGSTNFVGDIAYGNSTYVVSGTSNGLTTNNIVSSTDGITWVTRATLFWTSSTGIDGIVYGSAGFMVNGGGNAAVVGSVYVSTDSITWTTRNTGYAANWQASIYANGIYMLVDSSGYTVTSTDTVTWTVKSTGGLQAGITVRTNSTALLAYNNGVFVLAGSDNNTRGFAYVSTDGSNWCYKNIGYITSYGVIYGEKWVLYGNYGTGSNNYNYVTSTDPSGLTTQGAGIIWERKGNPNGVF